MICFILADKAPSANAAAPNASNAAWAAGASSRRCCAISRVAGGGDRGIDGFTLCWGATRAQPSCQPSMVTRPRNPQRRSGCNEGIVNLIGCRGFNTWARIEHVDRYARAATSVTVAHLWWAWVRMAFADAAGARQRWYVGNRKDSS